MQLDQTTESFSSSTLDGTVVSTVYSGDASNPFGGLTFTYLLTMDASSPDPATKLTVGSYAGFSTDLSYILSGSEVAPDTFTRSGSSNLGDTLRFQWTSGLLPGEVGALVIVQTDAQAYQVALGGVIDDSTANLTHLLAPSPDVTDTAGLLAAGMGLLLLFRRRFSRQEVATSNVNS